MSLRLEMLQVARLAPAPLGESAALVEAFIRGKQNPDGGFQDREGQSDLYYTVFAIDALTALQVELPEESLTEYLRSFGSGEALDFVHRCCLLRAWSAMPEDARGAGKENFDEVLRKIEEYRTPDGGYHQKRGAARASAYGCFLAYGAYADHGRRPEDAEKLGAALEALATPDGAWANEAGMPEGSTTATAAAVTLCRNLRLPIPAKTGDWLLARVHPQGGFLAFPKAPMPDLLSTAVALHALDGLQVSFADHKEGLLDYVDTLWDAGGGFHGHWADDELDCEYTYYGLLALGHLSL